MRTAEQQHGQLMGSPLSFRILNLANLLTVVCAVEEEIGRELTTREILDLPALFNGDDILFLGGEARIIAWKRVCTLFGLPPSAGKNYISTDFASLNSELYALEDYQTVFVPTVPLPVILNAGSRSSVSDRDKEFLRYQFGPCSDLAATDYSALCEHMRRRSESRDEYDKWLSFFVNSHPELKGVPNGIPWFTSRVDGGVGLIPAFGVELSGHQRAYTELFRKFSEMGVCGRVNFATQIPRTRACLQSARSDVIECLDGREKSFQFSDRPLRDVADVFKLQTSALYWSGNLAEDDLIPEVDERIRDFCEDFAFWHGIWALCWNNPEKRLMSGRYYTSDSYFCGVYSGRVLVPAKQVDEREVHLF